MPYQLIATLIVLATGVWVWLDAERLDARKGSLGGGLLDMGPVAWFVATLLVWIVSFPCYLIWRPRLVRAKAERAGQWNSSFGQPYAQPYTQPYAEAYGPPFTPPNAPPR